MNCVFCGIIAKQIPAEIVFEDSDFVAFNDIHPKGPHHILIVPRTHVGSVKELDEEGEKMAGRMIGTARRLALERDIGGYKLVFNVGAEAGQTVEHLHLHLVGGWSEAPEKVEV